MKKFYFIDNENNLNGYSSHRYNESQIEFDENEVNQFVFPKYENGVLSENIEKLNEEKFIVLRKKRDELFLFTLAIRDQYRSEKEGFEMGATNDQPKMSQNKYKEWLLYFKALRDLPETINIDDFTIAQINNFECFPQMPG